jgi:RNA polymerase sigma factor (sigma-70 family)
LYRYFQPRIIIYLTERYKSKELAEDIAQDFFFKKLPKIKFTEYIEHPTSWVFYVCEKLLLTELRKQNSEVEFNDNDEYLKVEVVAAIDETVLSTRHTSDEYFETLLLAGIDESIVEAFRKIDRTVAEIFIMRYYEGYSDKEIAEKLGKKYGNIRVLAHRGKGLLKILIKSVTNLFFFQSYK